MHATPMSPRRGSVVAVVLLGCAVLSGCGKEGEEPPERDPNATTMRMTGPDGEEVTAEIVETENGMRMRVKGNGEEQTIEMELPEGFRKPGSVGTLGDGSEQRSRWQQGREDIRASMREGAARQDEFERKFDEERNAFQKRFEEERRDFDRRFEEDGRRFDELRKRYPPVGGKPSAPPSPAQPAAAPDAQAPASQPSARAGESSSGDPQ